jgi:hypothetical protein
VNRTDGPAGAGGPQDLRLDARESARSGDRIAIAAFFSSSDSFDRGSSFETYADQNDRDCRRLTEAAASDRIIAEMGV